MAFYEFINPDEFVKIRNSIEFVILRGRDAGRPAPPAQIRTRGFPSYGSCLGSDASAYPLKRTLRTDPALCPECVLLSRVPLGQPPSLHSLRRRLPSFVRGLRRYYGAVRLPMAVHHRITSLDFPLRPGPHPSPPGSHGISRFSHGMFPDVLGVLDRAGSARDSRFRPVRCCLPHRRRRRHPEVMVFRGSIPSPSVPLSTLRLRPCGFLRMTRGRRGSLLLHRMTLSFITSRRFLSAHRRKPESRTMKR